jgi:DNA replication and repair protein RecF
LEPASVENLRVENFRNIGFLELNFHPAFNFFFGQNAQGKTTLLEAIYFLSELRSFRTQDLGSLLRHCKDSSSLSATVLSERLNYEVKIRFTSQQKEVFLNGKTPRPYRRLRRLVPIVLFIPESVRLFRSSPGERRSYFDHSFGLLSEGFSQISEEFTRILKQKKRVLELIREGKRYLLEEKEVWDEKLAETGAKLVTERFQWTSQLSSYFQTHFVRLSGGEWEAGFQYRPHSLELRSNLPLEEIQRYYREEIRRREKEEIERNQILVGPHRDDWEILLGTERLKEEGSQGQHRISVAALKLAELDGIRTQGLRPIALFDDLLSELDERRNRKVLEELAKTPCQVFLTSVTPGGIPLEELRGSTFHIEAGKVVK